MLKGLIVLLMIALLITLGAGLYFLMIDQGDVKKTRLVNSLRVRVGIAGTYGTHCLRCSDWAARPPKPLGHASSRRSY